MAVATRRTPCRWGASGSPRSWRRLSSSWPPTPVRGSPPRRSTSTAGCSCNESRNECWRFRQSSPDAMDKRARRCKIAPADVERPDHLPMSARVAAVVEIAMPRLSDTMEEGTIVAWLKEPGEPVTRGEELVEIETDKATITHAADGDGVLEIVAEAGQTVPVGAVIARLL